MVQSAMPSWASVPLQRCQCSVLAVGTIGPSACVLAADAPGDVLAGAVLGGAAVEPAEVQAATASRAASPAVSAAARPPRGGIGIPP